MFLDEYMDTTCTIGCGEWDMTNQVKELKGL